LTKFNESIDQIPLDFDGEESVVGHQTYGLPDEILPHGEAPFRGLRWWQHFAAATDGDLMGTARPSKPATREQRTTAKKPASPSRRLLVKLATARASKPSVKRKTGKIETIIVLLRRPSGASIGELSKATNWQINSVRGAISGMIKKKRGLSITSEKRDGVRLYRITNRDAG